MDLYIVFLWMGGVFVLLAIGLVIGTAVEKTLRERRIIRRYAERTTMNPTRLDEYNQTVDRR